MNRLRLLPALVGSLVLLGLTPLAAHAAGPTISGRVTDTAGKPVAGITVVYDYDRTAASTTTKADGTFSGTLAEGQTEVNVCAGGYASESPSGLDLTYNTRCAAEVTLPGSVNLSVSRRGTLRGTVTDAKGSPVAGAAVVGCVDPIRPNGQVGPLEPSQVTLTDDDGRYALRMPSASVAITASKSGYVTTDYKDAPCAGDSGQTLPTFMPGDKDLAGIDIVLPRVKTDLPPAAPSITNVHRPYAVGTPKAGWKLSARPGTWSPAAVTVTYRWTVAGKVVSSTPTFTPTKAQRGQAISLTATASAKGYRSASRTVPAGVIS